MLRHVIMEWPVIMSRHIMKCRPITTCHYGMTCHRVTTYHETSSVGPGPPVGPLSRLLRGVGFACGAAFLLALRGPESLREQKKVEKHMKAQRGQEASQWNGLVENGGSARPHRE